MKLFNMVFKKKAKKYQQKMEQQYIKVINEIDSTRNILKTTTGGGAGDMYIAEELSKLLFNKVFIVLKLNFLSAGRYDVAAQFNDIMIDINNKKIIEGMGEVLIECYHRGDNLVDVESHLEKKFIEYFTPFTIDLI